MYTHIKAQEVRLAAESADHHNPLHHLHDAAFQTTCQSIQTSLYSVLKYSRIQLIKIPIRILFLHCQLPN